MGRNENIKERDQKEHMSQLIRFWYVSSPENSLFKRACAALQSDFWSDPSSTSILYVCKQQRFWRDRVDTRLAWAFAGRLCDKYHKLMIKSHASRPPPTRLRPLPPPPPPPSKTETELTYKQNKQNCLRKAKHTFTNQGTTFQNRHLRTLSKRWLWF